MKTCRCSTPLRFDTPTAELDMTSPAVRLDLDLPAFPLELCLADVSQLDWLTIAGVPLTIAGIPLVIAYADTLKGQLDFSDPDQSDLFAPL